VSPVVASITPVASTLAKRQLVDAIKAGEKSVATLRAQASTLVEHAAQFKRDDPLFASLWAGHFALLDRARRSQDHVDRMRAIAAENSR
jgi:hypothetical protein